LTLLLSSVSPSFPYTLFFSVLFDLLRVPHAPFAA
jgi:hypothetical protein